MPNIFHQISNMDNNNENENRIKEQNRLKNIIQQRLPRYIDKPLFGMTKSEDINMLLKTMKSIIDQEDTFLRNYEIERFLNVFVLEITSLGKISSFMEDPSITEIMINSYDEIWIEKDGVKVKTNVSFENEEELFELAQRIARNVGRLIDQTRSFVDARLPDGSRVHIIIPPISKKGVTITIRKFFKEKLTIDDLIDKGTLSVEFAEFLELAVKSRCNLIVSGGTGSGKTTTLNVLSNFVPDNERIITIEDAAELQLNNSHIVSLETRNANAEGQGEVTPNDLVINALRMYPDRIILGEVRDMSAYDLLNSMSTGHEGSMSTLHSNDPHNCITRLTNLISEKDLGFDTKTIHSLIGESIDLIVQITRMRDKVRRIENISQVRIDHNGIIHVEPLYLFKVKKFDEDNNIQGEFVRTDQKVNKRIADKFILNGVDFEGLEDSSYSIG